MPVRVAAADALGRMGSNVVPAIGPMLAATTNAETRASVALIEGIRAMGAAAHEEVLKVFEQGNEALRASAGWVIWNFGAGIPQSAEACWASRPPGDSSAPGLFGIIFGSAQPQELPG